MADLLDKMIPGAERLAALPSGHILCCKCLKSAPVEDFKQGKGREFGQHPDHRFCKCGASITWHGAIQKLPNGKVRRVA